MTGEHLEDALSGLLDAELSPEEEAAAHVHLTSCQVCRNELEEVRTARSWVRALPQVDAPFGFYERLLRKGGSGGAAARATTWGLGALVGTAAAGLVVLGLASPRGLPVKPRVDRLVEAHATAEASGDDVSQLVPAAVPVVLASVPPAAQPSGLATAAAEHPLDRARRAVDEVPFHGVVEVRWGKADAVRRERLSVEAAGGVFSVHGEDGGVVEGSDEERLVRTRGGDWARVWPAGGGSALVPDPDGKYETTTTEGQAEVAGRATYTVEIRRRGQLVDRLYLDRQTELPLQRDQYGEDGRAERGFRFEALTVGGQTAPPVEPPAASDRAPRPVSAPVSASAPQVLDEGYVRQGAYRHDEVLHLLYTDGLYNLSLFEQPGRLASGAMPGSGETVDIDGASGRLYPWAGGNVLVWRSGHLVLTIVSDAPANHLVEAARSVEPSGAGSPSVVQKVRRMGGALLDPLG